LKDSASYYVSQYHRRQILFTDWHAMMDKWEAWMYLKHYDSQSAVPSANDNSPQYKHIDTVPFDFIRQAIAMLTTPNQVRELLTDDPTSKKAQAICDDGEKYLAGVWSMNRGRATVDPLTAIVFDQLVHSVAFVYVYCDEARLKLYNKEKRLPRASYFPLCIETLNPLCCFPDPTPGRWSWTDSFIRAETLSPQAVINLWGEDKVLPALDDGNYRDEDDEWSSDMALEYIDVWEWQMVKDEPRLFNGIIYNGKWIVEPRDMSESYSDLPIVMISGYDMPSPKMDRRHWSPLEPLIHATATGERLVNRIMTAAAFNAAPILIKQNMRDVVVQNMPGAQIDINNDQNLHYLTGVSVPPILLQFYQTNQGDIDRTSFSRANYGMAPASWAGTTFNQAITGSVLKLQPIVENLKKGLSDVDRHLLELTASYFKGKSVTAYGNKNGKPYTVKIKNASDLEGIQVQTNLTPKSPQDEQVKAGLAQMYRNPGATGTPLMPDEWIQKEIMGVEDITGLQKALYKQAYMQSATLRKYAMKMALMADKDWPPDIIDAAVNEIETQMASGKPAGPLGAEGGAPPPGGAPGAAPAPSGATPTPQEFSSLIDQAVQQGMIPQNVGDQAKQMLTSGKTVDEVIKWIESQKSMQQGATQQTPSGGQPPTPGTPMTAPTGQSPRPPMGQPPMPTGQPPTAPMPTAPSGQPPMPTGPQEGPSLKDVILAAVQAKELPEDIAQQAIQMLDQGQPEEQVFQWIQQQMQQQSQQGGVESSAAPQQGLTLEQAVQELTNAGAPPEVIQELQMLVQQGTSVEEALQVVLGKMAVGNG
jgi:hypothetical protein